MGAQQVINNKNGILFYGFAPYNVPFQGGTLCVTGVVRRTPAQWSGGNGGADDCSGSFSYDFNALIQSGSNPALQLGAIVGGYGLSLLGISGNGGIVATFIVALVGAVAIIWVVRKIKSA